MARIKQYFAKGELTPSNIGYSALETAGRRISPLYDQAAQSIEKEGQAVSKVWNQLKFGADVIAADRRGGGGGAKGGSVHDALDFGARSSWGSGNINPATGGDLEAPGGGPYRPGSLNTAAHNEISSAAPNLAKIADKLIAGQGITDTERMALDASKKANPYADLGYWDTKSGTFTKHPGLGDTQGAVDAANDGQTWNPEKGDWSGPKKTPPVYPVQSGPQLPGSYYDKQTGFGTSTGEDIPAGSDIDTRVPVPGTSSSDVSGAPTGASAGSNTSTTPLPTSVTPAGTFTGAVQGAGQALQSAGSAIYNAISNAFSSGSSDDSGSGQP